MQEIDDLVARQGADFTRFPLDHRMVVVVPLARLITLV